MHRTSNNHTHNLFMTPRPLIPFSAGFVIATRLPLDCLTIASIDSQQKVKSPTQGTHMLFTIKHFLAPQADIRFVPQLTEAIVRQSSGSRVAIEWLSSGNRFLQAVVAGVCYVRDRFSAGDDLGVFRGTKIVSSEWARF